MDGGGRFLRSLTGSVSRIAAARPGRSPGLPSLRRLVRARRAASAPLAKRLPRHLGTGLALGFFGAVVLTGLQLGGHLTSITERHGEPHHLIARMAGLGLGKITITGLAHLTEADLLARVGLDGRVSLPFLSAADLRTRLEQIPWVKAASVRKLYPSELVITLSEREPYALWQRAGEVSVIAADGTVLDQLRDGRFVDLPLVVGENANTRTAEYLGLLDAAGPLRGRVRAGTLVAGRRWTLKVDGIDIRLPEARPAEAMARLVRIEREQKILEKDVLAVDLRMPDRVVVRLTEEAASARADALKKRPTRGKGVDT